MYTGVIVLRMLSRTLLSGFPLNRLVVFIFVPIIVPHKVVARSLRTVSVVFPDPFFLVQARLGRDRGRH